MITDVRPAVSEVLDAAAAAVTRTLDVGEPLVASAPGTSPEDIPLQHAVLVPLGGTTTGEIAIFIDDELVQALEQSSLGALDLAAAISPLLDELAAALGAIVLGRGQTVDGRLARARLAAHAETGTVCLLGSSRMHAAVAVGLDPAPAPAAPRRFAPPSAERLDLLRGVEMSATVELGRARMTVNELLALTDGTIIELDRAAGEPADLFVNGRLLARGEVVVVDENYALRITQIISDEDAR